MNEGTGQNPPENSGQSAGERLDSWKEIAAYLKRDIRTVRRWEKSQGLPVHRHSYLKRGLVHAYKHELDSWWFAPIEKNSSSAVSEKDAFLLEVQEIWRRFLTTDSLFELKSLLHKTRALLSASEYSLHPKRHQAELLHEQLEQAIRWAAHRDAVASGGPRNGKLFLPAGGIGEAIDWSTRAFLGTRLIILIMLAAWATAEVYFVLRLRSEFGLTGDSGNILKDWLLMIGSSVAWITFLIRAFQQRLAARQMQAASGQVVMLRLIQGTLLVGFGAQTFQSLPYLFIRPYPSFFYYFGVLTSLSTLLVLTYLLLELSHAGQRSHASKFVLAAAAGSDAVRILLSPVMMIYYYRVPARIGLLSSFPYLCLHLPEFIVALFVTINLVRRWKQSGFQELEEPRFLQEGV